MQMIKGCEHNDPALRKTMALGLFRIEGSSNKNLMQLLCRMLGSECPASSVACLCEEKCMA